MILRCGFAMQVAPNGEAIRTSWTRASNFNHLQRCEVLRVLRSALLVLTCGSFGRDPAQHAADAVAGGGVGHLDHGAHGEADLDPDRVRVPRLQGGVQREGPSAVLM